MLQPGEPAPAGQTDGSDDDVSTEQKRQAFKKKSRTTLETLESACTLERAVSNRQRLWLLIEEPSLHPVALAMHYVFSLIVLASVVFNVLLTMPRFESSHSLLVLELVVNILFTSEVLLRMAICPSGQRLLVNPYMWIDFCAVFPFWLVLMFGLEPEDNPVLEFVMLLVPIFRLLKITRHSSGIRLLVISIQGCAAPLTVPAFLLLLMTVFFSCVIFWIEKHTVNADEDGIAFLSIPHVIWFVICTISTVGYGDVYPNSETAKMATCVLILCGVCYMAMPMAIIGGTFSRVWSDRDKILIAEKAKAKMADGGLNKDDLKDLFSAADTDDSGSINKKEFAKLIHCFHLGFTHGQAIKLFKSIDEDNTGLVSFEEFADFLFPELVLDMDEALEIELQRVEDEKAREYANYDPKAQNFINKIKQAQRLSKSDPAASPASAPPALPIEMAEGEAPSDLRATANVLSGNPGSSLAKVQGMARRSSSPAVLERGGSKDLTPPGMTQLVDNLETRIERVEGSISNLRSEHREQFQLLIRRLSPSKDPSMWSEGYIQ